MCRSLVKCDKSCFSGVEAREDCRDWAQQRRGEGKQITIWTSLAANGVRGE